VLIERSLDEDNADDGSDDEDDEEDSDGDEEDSEVEEDIEEDVEGDEEEDAVGDLDVEGEANGERREGDVDFDLGCRMFYMLMREFPTSAEDASVLQVDPFRVSGAATKYSDATGAEEPYNSSTFVAMRRDLQAWFEACLLG
jgi:hypothetical protein